MIIKCEECGHEISDKAKICPNCGNLIKEEVKEKTVSIKPVVVLLSLIFAFGIVSVGYVFLNNLGVFQKTVVQTETSIGKDEKLIEVGKKSNLFPYDVDKLSFRSGDESDCICTKIMPIGNGLYELAFTAPMLSNSTADGTYAVSVSYTVKVGDKITLVNTDRYIPSPVVIEITHLAPNNCWYKQD